MIPFLGYAPDLDPATPGVLTSVTNVVPSQRGMKGAPTGGSTGYAALAAECRGAAVMTKLDGTARFIAGTAVKLYEGASAAWTERTRGAPSSPSNYTMGTAGRWRFAVFGNSVLAVDGRGADVLQRSPTDVFADVSGPKADCIATSANFVMLASTYEATNGDQSDRWWCSAILDETSWTASVATQCTTGRLVDAPGPIIGLRALGTDFVAYKADAIFVGRYIGPPVVFSWIHIPGHVGSVNDECIVSIGTAHYFIGSDDIWMFDGSRPQAIGAPLREWFFRHLDKSNKHKILGMHDAFEGNVYWFYPTATSGGAITSAIVYNYRTNRWGAMTLTVEAVVNWQTDQMTYAGLGTLYSSYADIPTVSYDSPLWFASNRIPAYFDTAHTLKSLDGATASAQIVTGDYGDDTQFSLLRRVRPNYKSAPTSATMTNYYKDDSGDNLTTGVTTTMVQQRFDVLLSSRWHRFQFDTVGNFEIAGITPDVVAEGVD